MIGNSENKRHYIISLILVLLFIAIFFIGKQNISNEEKWDKIPMVCVDEIVYYLKKSDCNLPVDNYKYIGVIQSTVDGTKIPKNNMESNNFYVGSKVYKFNDYIIVENGDGKFSRLKAHYKD